MRTLTGFGITLFLAVSGASAQSPARNVDLRAADGTLIRATHFPAARPGPAVILLHMCNSQRGAWDRLGPLLSSMGIHAIAPDYRGYGESGGERLQHAPRDQARHVMRELWPVDLDVVYEFLLQQPGVDRSRVGAAGGSCGGGNAIELAKRHPEIQTLVLLAGGMGPGPEFLRSVPWMPVLGVAARDDGNAVQLMRQMIDTSTGGKNRFVEYQTGGHGTDLFRVYQDLEPLIADWFLQHLVTAPGRR